MTLLLRPADALGSAEAALWTADALGSAEAAIWTADALGPAEVVVLVPPTPGPDPAERGEDFGKAAPVGLVVILLFFLAVALLVRSMNKHLRRIPKSFDDDPDEPPRE